MKRPNPVIGRPSHPDSGPALALIPARGGSKAIPRKNLVSLHGRPLLEYTLRAALDASCVDEVWLSSDDSEILELGRRFGVRTLKRPAVYSGDMAPAADVVRHFLTTLPAELRDSDPLIVYLQPTSPLRGAYHIDAALRLMAEHRASALLSVVELQKSPYKAFRLDQQQRLESLFDERMSNARRQDLPRTYIPNGAIYAFRASEFTVRGGFPSNGSIAFLMTEDESVDIDMLDDIERVERILGDANG